MKKKPETKIDVETEEKEFLKKNRFELEKGLGDLVKKHNLPFDPPFSDEDSDEIIRLARQAENEEIEKLFPAFSRYGEDMKVNCKLCWKFQLDPKIVTDRRRIMEAISKKLDGSSSQTKPELYKFKKN